MKRRAALPAKLVRPTQAGAYRRPRLFSLLDRARPVAWVSGPPGAGKTTLVASYVEARRLRPLWCQLDEGDADVATLFYYLRLAAQCIAPRKRWRLPLLTPEYLPGLDTFARRWFEELFAGLPRPFSLVLDNYHSVAAESPLHDVVRCALETLAHGGRAILVSRADPPSALARLRVDGRLSLVDWNEVRLTPTETAGIAKSRAAAPLSSEQARALHAATDGWAAGVVLMLERAGTEEAPTARMGRQPVFDYFASEILARADAETRQILLETSLLPKVTGAQSEALTGSPRAPRILAELARRRYFTDAHPHSEPTYQYHPLFREFLRARANEQLSAERRTELRRQAASLLEGCGQLEDAAELLQQAADWQLLEGVVLRHAPTLLAHGRGSIVESWLTSIPGAVLDASPWLLYWRAACHLSRSANASVTYAERAYEGFVRRGDRAGVVAAACLAVDAMTYEWGGFTALDRWIAALESLLDGSAAELPEDLRAQGIASLFSALLWRQPDHPQMSRWAKRAEDCFERSADVDFRARVGLSVGWYFMFQGDFAKATLITESLAAATSAAETSPLAGLWARGLEMQLAWLNANARRCLETVAGAQAQAEASGVRVLDMLFVIAQTFGQLIGRDLVGARKSLEQLRRGTQATQLARLTQYHYLASWAAMLDADVAAAHAHAVAAEVTAT